MVRVTVGVVACLGERDSHTPTDLGGLPVTGHWGWLRAQPAVQVEALRHQLVALKASARALSESSDHSCPSSQAGQLREVPNFSGPQFAQCNGG